MRILCARELQNSIADSVHRLLSDIVVEHELDKFYKVQQKSIVGINGTEFIFKGLKHNIIGIKSTEAVDICWVEEAEAVSDGSWEVLIPTIRKEDSEIWVSFNPKFPGDPTYRRFVTDADGDMLVRKVSWRDNPFFPEVLMKEMLRLKENDLESYKHIWEGEFDTRYSGGVYAQLLEQARRQGRITAVPYKPGIPVVTAWDLGKANSTAIWFVQRVGFQTRIIDYYEASGKPLDHFADILREKEYTYGEHYLPHDARHDRIGMDGSISGQLHNMGVNNFVLPNDRLESGLETARLFIREVLFDEEKCKDGIHALMHYQYEWDADRHRFKDKPLHDWSSDGADAFRYLAIAMTVMEDVEYGLEYDDYEDEYIDDTRNPATGY